MRAFENGLHGGGVTLRGRVADDVYGIGARPGLGKDGVELGDQLRADLGERPAELHEIVHGKDARASAIGHDQKLASGDRLE